MDGDPGARSRAAGDAIFNVGIERLCVHLTLPTSNSTGTTTTQLHANSARHANGKAPLVLVLHLSISF